MKTVCVMGEGAWGTALATILAHNGYHVNLWCHDAAVAEQINNNRINERYLERVTLSNNIHPTTDLAHALRNVEWVFEAIPVKYLRSVIEQVQPLHVQQQKWVVLSKGIEKETLLLPTEIIAQILGGSVEQLVVSGPSFAREVAFKELTGLVIAATNSTYAQELQTMLSNDYIVTTVTTDIKGVQIAGAYKNVLALGNGLLTGSAYQDNTQALYLTRGLQEIVYLLQHLGGQPETAYDLAGVGDLLLTATSIQSRNVQVGELLADGATLQNIIEETGYTPEGVNTVQSMHQLMQRENIALPLCDAIYNVVFNNKPVDIILDVLRK